MVDEVVPRLSGSFEVTPGLAPVDGVAGNAVSVDEGDVDCGASKFSDPCDDASNGVCEDVSGNGAVGVRLSDSSTYAIFS